MQNNQHIIEITPARAVVQCGWDDVPHLDNAIKEATLASYPLHERECRTTGRPGLGSGAIYPVSKEDFVFSPFEIPDHWPRIYGMDVGWKKTAVIWGAIDLDGSRGGIAQNGCMYLYAEYYRGQAEPATHVMAIKARGDWIPGVIDPASNGRSQIDGSRLLDIYNGLGLKLEKAENSVEAGIFQVFEMLSTGILKISTACPYALDEIMLYRRDENGKIVKENDHLMDAMRYLIVSGRELAIRKPFKNGMGGRTTMGDRNAGY